MLSGLKLTPFADNAQFYGLAGGKAHFETLFDTAFVIWRKKGVVTRRSTPRTGRTRASSRRWPTSTRARRCEEPSSSRPSRRPTDRAIVNKSSRSTSPPGSDEIMAGCYFTLDALGETMTVVRQHLPARRGQHRRARARDDQQDALREARRGGEELPREELPDVRRARFQTIGHGAENPIADNTTEAGRAAQPPHGHQGRPERAVSAGVATPRASRAVAGARASPIPRRAADGLLRAPSRASASLLARCWRAAAATLGVDAVRGHARAARDRTSSCRSPTRSAGLLHCLRATAARQPSVLIHARIVIAFVLSRRRWRCRSAS